MKTPSKTRIDALITYLEQPMPLELACELAFVDTEWVLAAFEAAREDDGSELAELGVKIRNAQAQAVSEQISSMQSKARKDWKANAHLAGLLSSKLQPKTGAKELAEAVGAVAVAVLELPAKVNAKGQLALPDKGDD
jgi:hypothetical protein